MHLYGSPHKFTKCIIAQGEKKKLLLKVVGGTMLLNAYKLYCLISVTKGYYFIYLQI